MKNIDMKWERRKRQMKRVGTRKIYVKIMENAYVSYSKAKKIETEPIMKAS